MTKDRFNAFTLGALGMLSGATTWAFEYVVDRLPLPAPLSFILYALGPGLVFGLIIGSLLGLRGKLAGWRLPAYVVAASFASFVAIHASLYVKFEVFNLLFWDEGPKEAALIEVVGGLVWSVLLGFASIPLLRMPTRNALGFPILIAGAFVLLVPVFWLVYALRHWTWAPFALSTLWPGAYAASLAPILRPAKSKR